MKPKKLFISYSHEDERLYNDLLKHLSSLKNEGLIEIWHDRAIEAGKEWKQLIDKNLNDADIIMLLISASFLASEFIRDVELERALERHEKKEAVVVPVILRKVDWQGERFKKLQALPKDAKPITLWDNVDEAFADVAVGIRKVITATNPQTARGSQMA